MFTIDLGVSFSMQAVNLGIGGMINLTVASENGRLTFADTAELETTSIPSRGAADILLGEHVRCEN